MTSAPESKTPMRASCKTCEHVWTFAWLPMELTAWAKLAKGLCCPYCGQGNKRIFVHMPGTGAPNVEAPE